MKPLYAFVLSALLPFAACAEVAVASATMPEAEVALPYGPVAASDTVFADQLYIKRPVVVFADSPNDPNFVRQIELLLQDLDSLEMRDVILVTDTDPAAKTEWRLKLRPRGYSLVLMDKDLSPVIRKPLPWEVREISRAIDKFPLRRQEVLERNPAGR
jgi:hypothetical protein